MEVPLSSISLDGREAANVLDALEAGWLSGSGSYVEAFEQAIARRVGREHVVAVNSGTSALELVLLALGIGRGDEVIVPALTFVAPAAATRAVGATPILCDIRASDWTIDPELVRRLIGPRTKAAIVVDVLGHPCDFDALADLGLPVIEDAAEAHGARYRDQPAGSFGIASIFSFHANKPVSTGEGGAIATNDPQLATAVRVLKNHGMRRERPYWHDVVGKSFHMTNLTAAVGLAQAERWESLTAARDRVATEYLGRLAKTSVVPRPVSGDVHCACWLHTITVPDRDRVVSLLRSRGVDARAIWPALSSLPLYRPSAPYPCPVAERIAGAALWLPTWADMPTETIEYVAAAVVAALGIVDA